MFNPYFIQVEGERAVYVVTSGAVVHVKNPTHKQFLERGGIPAEPQKVTKQELKALLEQE